MENGYEKSQSNFSSPPPPPPPISDNLLLIFTKILEKFNLNKSSPSAMNGIGFPKVIFALCYARAFFFTAHTTHPTPTSLYGPPDLPCPPDGTFKPTSATNWRKKIVTLMWYSNDMFHYTFEAEFATLVSLKVPSGTRPPSPRPPHRRRDALRQPEQVGVEPLRPDLPLHPAAVQAGVQLGAAGRSHRAGVQATLWKKKRGGRGGGEKVGNWSEQVFFFS